MLNKLRSLFSSKQVNGYIIPSWDEFQNEYVTDEKNRLKLLTGFNGSNGILALLEKKALFFTDGRYLEQAHKTLDAKVYDIFDFLELKNFNWSKYIENGQKIGYDPMLFTTKQLGLLADDFFVATEGNLVDEICQQKPAYQHNIQIYPLQFSGQSAAEKLQNIRKKLATGTAQLITNTSSVCWLLNLRDFGPSTVGMFDAYLLINTLEGALFTDAALTEEIIAYLRQLQIKVMASSLLPEFLAKTSHIKLDISTCPTFLLPSPSSYSNDAGYNLEQAVKNQQELEGSIFAHIEDAIALCEFFSWLEASSNLTEADLADALIAFRGKSSLCIKESFHAICGFAANSSIIHYRADKNNSTLIKDEGLLLIDSGGHYYGGTTDVTRVICKGQPTEEQKLAYTLVLKGHISLANAKFKPGTCGKNLDILARQFLWQHNMDYPHSTGHGVGNFLNVHEGPQSISLNSDVALLAGMIISNEPGYYKEAEFGIRIENLMYVQENKAGFLEFKTLTLLPFEAKLIDEDLLEKPELQWLANYYETIASLVRPKLTKLAQNWLDKQLCAIKF